MFENFLADVEDGGELILNKIQGVGHGGGVQVAAGSVDFANMEHFLGLLGHGDDTGSGLSPETTVRHRDDGLTGGRRYAGLP